MKSKINEVIAEMEIATVLPTRPCKRCGRKLSNIKSLERGYGPVCFKKIQSRQKLTMEMFANASRRFVEESW